MNSPEHYGYSRVTYTPEEGFTSKDVAHITHVRGDTITLEKTLKYPDSIIQEHSNQIVLKEDFSDFDSLLQYIGREMVHQVICLIESVCRDVELLKTTAKLNGNNYIADMCDYVMDDLNRIRSILSEDRNDILDKEE